MLSTRLGFAVSLCLSLTASSVFAAERTTGPSGPVQYTMYAAPTTGAANGGTAYGAGYGGRRYPTSNTPLYPAPVQYVPGWTGGTVITNQAFSPHEMLYPHAYHAMYPPFYYRVTGKWLVTPFGVRQHEQWKLEGTHVKVKYHDHFRLFSNFHPPVSH